MWIDLLQDVAIGIVAGAVIINSRCIGKLAAASVINSETIRRHIEVTR